MFFLVEKQLDTRVLLNFQPIVSTQKDLTDFYGAEAKISFLFKMANSKILRFSKSSILKFVFVKISWIKPWIVGLIDVKDIDVAQLI